MSSDPQRILITGAGSGIGRALLDRCASQGANCVAMVRDDAEARGLRGLLPAERVFVVDLARLDEVADVTRAALKSLGGLDGVACCAGVFDHRAGLATSRQEWQAVLDVNLSAAFETARECAAAMIAQRRGSIVFVSSQIGLVGHRQAAAYAASKAGLNGLTRALALELAPHNVRVNAVAPGPISTPMTAEARADAARSAALLASIPLGRYGSAGEVAATISFLLSDVASFTTGQILCVDGGVTAA
jgi:NAD(P)-dependent dehydrogenase (short-subunit alcohol dehydrogenase family)